MLPTLKKLLIKQNFHRASSVFEKITNIQRLGNFSTTTNLFNLVPIVIDKTGKGERAYDVFSRLLKERIICVMGPIEDNMASSVIAQLLFLQSEHNRQPIHMYINSPGGVVTAGLGIYDVMQYVQPPIATWCVGQACSMASLLLAAGAPGWRHALPNSRIMIHQPSGQASGQATDIQIQAEEIIFLKKRIYGIYERHIKQDYDKIASYMERDKFMNAQEAKEFGLIDTIIEKMPKAQNKVADSETKNESV